MTKFRKKFDPLIYSILSLVETPGDRRNLFALSGIRINGNLVLTMFVLTSILYVIINRFNKFLENCVCTFH